MNNENSFHNYKFQSIYKIKIEEFINMKMNMGYKYLTQALLLRYIDVLARETRETNAGFTEKFYKKWLNSRPNESVKYRYARQLIFRSFSKYLLASGITSYIPPLPRSDTNIYIPYIYSNKQIDLIFKYTDTLEDPKNFLSSSLVVFSPIIRLLYSTGIRISEVLNLKDDDVLLSENLLIIKNSKNGKDRLLPISNSMADVLKTYVSYRTKFRYKNQQNFFFIKPDGEKPHYSGISARFRKCLIDLEIFGDDKNIKPRLHDLRHTFAVNAMASMAEEGIDLYVSLPILSQYLGHSSIGATNHYLRLTSNMYPNLINDMDILTLDIFPKK